MYLSYVEKFGDFGDTPVKPSIGEAFTVPNSTKKMGRSPKN
jgi:hypothetical protein